jgi:nucleoside phosphorylase
MVAIAACGDGDSDGSQPQPLFAVLSAFPGELAAVLEHVAVDETMVIDGHKFRTGTLGGKRVVVAMTGIGLANADAITTAVLDHFAVTGLVFSGVAGSSLNIADVAVPEQWTFGDGQTYAAHQEWLALANRIATSNGAAFERCTHAPTVTSPEVCLPNPPALVVGGVGASADTYNGKPVVCQPNGGDVFGCDVAASVAAAPLPAVRRAAQTVTTAGIDPSIVQDMETAAFAKVASARGVPFIAFRAVSDGAGDPLDLHGSFTQFFAYYRLAAHNAAAAAAAFLERVDK